MRESHRQPFTDCTIDDYRTITAVNLAGFFHITQRTIPQMLRSRNEVTYPPDRPIV